VTEDAVNKYPPGGNPAWIVREGSQDELRTIRTGAKIGGVEFGHHHARRLWVPSGPANLPVINDRPIPKFPVTACRENGVAVRYWSNPSPGLHGFLADTLPHSASSHHHVMTVIGVDMVTGVLARNGDSGEGDGPRATHPALLAKFLDMQLPNHVMAKQWRRAD
jgi:hypothetical protein